MEKFYLKDPKSKDVKRELYDASLEYFYFAEPLTISTDGKTVCNFCLLEGSASLNRSGEKLSLNQFDLVFLPEKEQVTINPSISNRDKKCYSRCRKCF